MSLFFEKIPIIQSTSYIIRSFDVPFIDFPKHYHPEYELTYLYDCSGTRIVGDSKSDFENADLAFIGSNLPHQYQVPEPYIEKKSNPKQIVIQIDKAFFESDFFTRAETEPIARLLKKAQQGVSFYGQTLQNVGSLMHILHKQQNSLPGMLCFLKILTVLSESEERNLLSSASYAHKPNQAMDKINPVFSFLYNHFQEQINLRGVSSHFNMSPSAFAHFLKKKTGKTFSTFLNELRIGFVCKQLGEGKNISQSAYIAGYNNLSYFNRKFKELKKITPMEYKQKVEQIS